MNNVVITIARGFGSGGKYIAKKLADELGIPCYDRQLLTLASQASGIDENLFVDMDEKLNGPSIMKMASAPSPTIRSSKNKMDTV